MVKPNNREFTTAKAALHPPLIIVNITNTDVYDLIHALTDPLNFVHFLLIIIKNIKLANHGIITNANDKSTRQYHPLSTSQMS